MSFYRLVQTTLLLQHLTDLARLDGSAARMAVGNVDLQRRLKGDSAESKRPWYRCTSPMWSSACARLPGWLS